MKGAFDGGLEIPHSEKKFYGYDPDEKEYSAEANRDRILGDHVATYMNSLQEEEEEEYAKKFSKYIEAGISGDDLEALYLEVHKKIRENPDHVATEKKVPADVESLKKDGGVYYTNDQGKRCFINRRRHSISQRKNRVAQKKAFVLNSKTADDEEEDEE